MTKKGRSLEIWAVMPLNFRGVLSILLDTPIVNTGEIRTGKMTGYNRVTLTNGQELEVQMIGVEVQVGRRVVVSRIA